MMRKKIKKIQGTEKKNHCKYNSRCNQIILKNVSTKNLDGKDHK